MKELVLGLPPWILISALGVAFAIVAVLKLRSMGFAICKREPTVDATDPTRSELASRETINRLNKLESNTQKKVDELWDKKQEKNLCEAERENMKDKVDKTNKKVDNLDKRVETLTDQMNEGFRTVNQNILKLARDL